MSRVYDFYTWVWMNMRRAIRSLGVGSLWYRSLDALLGVLVNRSLKAEWLLNQIFIETASGRGLDMWGKRYLLYRNLGESDYDFRVRILIEYAIRKKSPSGTQRIDILSKVLKIDTSEIRVVNVYDYVFRVGGIVGKVCGTRNYDFFTYRIYLPALTEDMINRAIWVMNYMNIGGNVPELWVRDETGDVLDVPLYEPLTNPKLRYKVY